MGPSEEVQVFERATLLGRRYFFRVVDVGNNETLAPSQPYKTWQQRDKTARRFADAFGCKIVSGKRR